MLCSYRTIIPPRQLFRVHLSQHRNHLLTSSPRIHLSTNKSPSAYQRSRSGGSDRSNSHVPLYIIFGVGVPLVGGTAASIYAYYSCLDNVPYTDRRRFIATSPQFEKRKGDETYQALLKQFKDDILPSDHRASVTVKRVGSRIAVAAQSCSRDWETTSSSHNNKQTKNNTSPFTYTVVRSPEANAFVIPGNHIFVFTGLFRYAHNEDELASVLGHEMAHNIARHAGERMSEGILMTILSRLALIFDPSGILFSILVPAQTLLVSLPHSREHEVEADRIGVILASEACYDPRAAKRVFSRMKDDSEGDKHNGGQPPEFLSTHPGFDTRLTLFDQWMPDALGRFNKDGGNKCRSIREEMKRARKLAAAIHDGKEGRQITKEPTFR